MTPIELLVTEKVRLKAELDAIEGRSVRDECRQHNLASTIDEYTHAIALLREEQRRERRIINQWRGR